MAFRCRICQRNFSTVSGLTRHANAVHQRRTTLSQVGEPRLQQPEHDENLWNAPITLPTLMNDQNDPVPDHDAVEISEDEPRSDGQENESIAAVIPQPRYNLRSQVPFIKTEENDEESETESQQSMNLEEPNFDSEDLEGASLDDALDTIEGKNRPERIA
jgi:hypothetical protein